MIFKKLWRTNSACAKGKGKITVVFFSFPLAVYVLSLLEAGVQITVVYVIFKLCCDFWLTSVVIMIFSSVRISTPIGLRKEIYWLV